MAVNETQVTGRKYRVWDDINNIWKRFSFWTKASDVELNNGTTVEGAISQINTNKANKSGGNTFTGDQTFSNIIKSKSTNVSIGTSGTNWGNSHIDIFDSNNTRVAYICPKQTSSGAVDLYISSDLNDNSNGKVYVNGVDVNELKDSLTKVVNLSKNYIICIEIQITDTIPANSYKPLTFTIPDGFSDYRALIAIYRNNNNSNNVVPVDTSTIYFNTNNEFTLTLRNFGNSNASGYFRAFVILVKPNI